MYASKHMSVKKKVHFTALRLMGNKYMQHTIKNKSLCSPQMFLNRSRQKGLDLLRNIAQNRTSFVILCSIFQDLFVFHFQFKVFLPVFLIHQLTTTTSSIQSISLQHSKRFINSLFNRREPCQFCNASQKKPDLVEIIV